jgi:hypothetical protein
MGPAPRQAASTVSTLEVHRQRIAGRLDQGVNGTTSLAALRRKGLPGHYSSLYRMIVAIHATFARCDGALELRPWGGGLGQA